MADSHTETLASDCGCCGAAGICCGGAGEPATNPGCESPKEIDTGVACVLDESCLDLNGECLVQVCASCPSGNAYYELDDDAPSCQFNGEFLSCVMEGGFSCCVPP